MTTPRPALFNPLFSDSVKELSKIAQIVQLDLLRRDEQPLDLGIQTASLSMTSELFIQCGLEARNPGWTTDLAPSQHVIAASTMSSRITKADSHTLP